MKNVREIYVRLIGDVYAKYIISAETLADKERPTGELVSLQLTDEEYGAMYDAGKLIVPNLGGPIYDKDYSSGKREKKPTFNINGTLTAAGVYSIVNSVSRDLLEAAWDVWEQIDPRCSAKVPSRLYRNTAYICADILTHLGIPSKVSTLELDPSKHNGLKKQYRVVVNTKVPVYPWKKECTPDEKNPNKTYHRPVPVYENLNFDFDVTNGLRVQWVWPGSPRVIGEDVRVLRNGRPVRWVDSLGHLSRDGYSHFTIMRGSQTPIEAQADGELLLKQTSLVSVLEAVSDGTSEGMVEALNKMFNSPMTKSTAKSAITQMSLG